MKPLFCLSLLAMGFPAFAHDLAALTADTKKAVLPVVPQVVNAVQDAMAEKGAVNAIPICKEKAPALIQAKRKETGWDIRRVSLKARNTQRATPDIWEVRQLAYFNVRVATGEKPEALENSQIEYINGKPVLRYIKALPVGDVCLKCHGAEATLDPQLKAKLRKYYPSDQATGYNKGEIRGALSVKRPL